MKVALIGTGLMGRPMGERILAAGYHLTVFNRSREKAELLRSSGAEIAATAAEAIGSAECVLLMLADGVAIREVLFNENPKPDLGRRTVIQMGTISPADSVALEKKVLGRGGEYLEAPVLGSIPEASAGKLLIMVGATKPQFDKCSTLLECFGSEPLLIGEVGKFFFIGIHPLGSALIQWAAGIIDNDIINSKLLQDHCDGIAGRAGTEIVAES